MDALKIEGRILKVMPAQSGTSQRTGNSWMTQEYVLQFHVWDGARNPNYFIFRVFGEDRIKQFAIKEGGRGIFGTVGGDLGIFILEGARKLFVAFVSDDGQDIGIVNQTGA